MSRKKRPGDLIFFQGTLGDGVAGNDGITHVALYVGDGYILNCGNPISYADLSRAYWQEHFYGFGRMYRIKHGKEDELARGFAEDSQQPRKGGQRRQARREKAKKLAQRQEEAENMGILYVVRSMRLTPEELEDFLAGKPPQDKEKHEEHEEQEEQRDDESFEE